MLNSFKFDEAITIIKTYFNIIKDNPATGRVQTRLSAFNYLIVTF